MLWTVHDKLDQYIYRLRGASQVTEEANTLENRIRMIEFEESQGNNQETREKF